MKLTFRLSLAALILICSVPLFASQTVAPANPANANIPAAAPQHFVCNTGYSVRACHEQMTVLRPLLVKYGASRLGDWTWVLVKSDDWMTLQGQLRKSDDWMALQGRLRMDPDSPALTILDRRETFFDEALVSPVSTRRIELIGRWSLGIDDLLKLAVTHELGHALCNEKNERKADMYGEQLRKGITPNCK